MARVARSAKQGWRVTVVVASLLVLLAVGAWYLWARSGSTYQLVGSLGPEALAERTISALEHGDCDTLLRLADQEEITRLNLSKASLESILRATLWAKSYPRRVSVRRNPGPNDLAQFRVVWAGDSRSQSFALTLIQDRVRGWKLNLSLLVRLACAWEMVDFRRAQKRYYSLADAHGWRGLREADGSYVTLKQYGARIRYIDKLHK